MLTSPVKSTYQARLDNLRMLADFYGDQAALARALKCAPSFISQLLAVPAKRNVGEKLARKIEQRCGLPEGYLDRPTPVKEVVVVG